VKNFDDRFSRFTAACDRQTDWRTDGGSADGTVISMSKTNAGAEPLTREK